jgi:hypothetical protein
VNANHVLQSTGHEEELLHQAEFFTLNLLIIGIQHLTDIF